VEAAEAYILLHNEVLLLDNSDCLIM